MAATTTPAKAPAAGSDPNYTTWISPTSWEVQILDGIGAPITKINVAILNAWTQSEGTLWANNPFAISGVQPGSTKCIAQCNTNSPIMAYSTLAQGIENTIKFLNASSYSGIVQALQAANYQQTDGTSKSQIQAASGQIGAVWTQINISSWCKGCSSGLYPSALYTLVKNYESNPAVANPSGGPSVGTLASGAAGAAAGAAGSAVGSVLPAGLTSILGDLSSATFWERLGLFALGFVLTIGGLGLFLADTKAGKEVGSVAALA